MQLRHQHVGGSFAPPLDAEKLASYRALIEALSPTDPHYGPVRSAALPLVEMVEAFRQTPDSARPAVGTLTVHLPGGDRHLGVVPLENSEVKRMWDLVPWRHECTALGILFDGIDAVQDKDLRNAAYHLLWFARELTEDREPLTSDKLG